MDHGIHLLLFKQLRQHGGVAYISVDTRRRKTQDFFEPLQHRAACIAEVIQYQKRQACFSQGYTDMRANIAGSASHEYHKVLSNDLLSVTYMCAINSDTLTTLYCPVRRAMADNFLHIICATQ